jgi:hypothetical protein
MNFEQFLDRLGGLHDARVSKLELDVAGKSLSFQVDDIYSNFFGLPGYKGPRPGRIVLKEINDITIVLEGERRSLNIDEFCVEPQGEISGKAFITFWPYGKITTSFHDVEFFDYVSGDQG